MSGSDFAWQVELPEQRRVPMGAPKPRACVTTESGEAFSVPLSVGRILMKERGAHKTVGSRSELVYHLVELQKKQALEKVVAFVTRRDHSVGEAVEKLKKDGFWDEPVTYAVQRAQDLRVLDDVRFADVFIRSKAASGWGEKRIERELAKKGIEVSGIPGWPDEYFVESEYDRALAVASTRRLTGKDPYAKVVRYLVGRGFSSSVAHRVASDLTKDVCQDAG